MASGGDFATGGDSGDSGSGGMDTGTGGAGTGGASGIDDSFASELDELFVDVPCDAGTSLPLSEGATCQHPGDTQHIENTVAFGGSPGVTYEVTLRVRGIWEPTKIVGGNQPDMEAPFTIGGQVEGGPGSASDAINYQQYYIEVAEPEQVYWLNNYGYVAHDIHKADYEVTLTVAGGSEITIVMHDGNERQIANFTQDKFEDVAPYEQSASLGQLLRLDVLGVGLAP